jgi:hypothetical protein
MSTRAIFALAIAYTVIVAVMISVADVSGVVVIAVAWAWFNLGRMAGRGFPQPKPRWGRQP